MFNFIHFIITISPFRKFRPPYLGKAIAAARAVLPSPTSACFHVSVIHRTLTWSPGSLTCVRWPKFPQWINQVSKITNQITICPILPRSKCKVRKISLTDRKRVEEVCCSCTGPTPWSRSPARWSGVSGHAQPPTCPQSRSPDLSPAHSTQRLIRTHKCVHMHA